MDNSSYNPYNGGLNVSAPTPPQANSLSDVFGDWLSLYGQYKEIKSNSKKGGTKNYYSSPNPLPPDAGASTGDDLGLKKYLPYILIGGAVILGIVLLRRK